MSFKTPIFKKIKKKLSLKLQQFAPFPTHPPFCAIFLFHTVEKNPQPWTKGHRYVTRFDQFKTQINYIKKHFQVLPSTELIEKLKSNNIKKNSAAIHFDDGFHSYSEIVVPFLKTEKIPSTIFLINSVIEGEVPIRNKLAFCLNSKKRSSLIDEWQKIAIKNDNFNLTRTKNSEILSWAKRTITKDMESVVDNIYKKCIKEVTLPHPFLNKKNILKLKQEPLVEFGSHTLNHLILSRLNSKQQRYEIIEGHEKLEKFLEMELIHFAYPHGGKTDFDETSEELVKKCNRITAYSSYGGINFEFNPTNIKRISLSNHSPKEIKKAILALM